MKSATIVVGIYDWDEVNLNSYRRLLSLDSNLFIFCEPELKDKIVDARKIYDINLSKTHFVEKTFVHLDSYFVYHDKIKSQDSNNILLEYNGPCFVRDAALSNPFKSSHFIVVRPSTFQANDEYYKERTFPLNNDLLNQTVVMFYSQEDELVDGNIIVVPQDSAHHFYHLTRLELWHYAHQGVPISCNKALTLVAQSHPIKHELIVCEGNGFDILMENKEEVLSVPIKNVNKNIVCVINHYAYDTSWVSRLLCDYVIYNKNPHHTHLYEINIPNLGFDSIVYLRYIVDNYDKLPDYMVFLQDDPFYHCMNVLDIINNFQFDREFVPLSATYYLGAHDQKKTEDYAISIGLAYENPLKMIASAMCIVSKNLVLKTEKEMYEKIISTIDKTVKCEANYCIENLWPTILNFNKELQPHHWNCIGYGGNP